MGTSRCPEIAVAPCLEGHFQGNSRDRAWLPSLVLTYKIAGVANSHATIVCHRTKPSGDALLRQLRAEGRRCYKTGVGVWGCSTVELGSYWSSPTKKGGGVVWALVSFVFCGCLNNEEDGWRRREGE